MSKDFICESDKVVAFKAYVINVFFPKYLHLTGLYISLHVFLKPFNLWFSIQIF